MFERQVPGEDYWAKQASTHPVLYPSGAPMSDALVRGEIAMGPLLGPSGCGKTTTSRCVAGLEHPTGSEISIGGNVVSSPTRGILVPPRQRDLSMVFQSYAVWPHMTVRQNVIYPLKHRKLSREAARMLLGLSRHRAVVV